MDKFTVTEDKLAKIRVIKPRKNQIQPEEIQLTRYVTDTLKLLRFTLDDENFDKKKEFYIWKIKLGAEVFDLHIQDHLQLINLVLDYYHITKNPEEWKDFKSKTTILFCARYNKILKGYYEKPMRRPNNKPDDELPIKGSNATKKKNKTLQAFYELLLLSLMPEYLPSHREDHLQGVISLLASPQWIYSNMFTEYGVSQFMGIPRDEEYSGNYLLKAKLVAEQVNKQVAIENILAKSPYGTTEKSGARPRALTDQDLTFLFNEKEFLDLFEYYFNNEDFRRLFS